MYGAMREHAPSSTRFTGLVSATALTLAMGYVLANGMGLDITRNVPDPITYVALPETGSNDPPPLTPDALDAQGDTTLVSPTIDVIIPIFEAEEGPIIGNSDPPPNTGNSGPSASVPPPRSPVRTVAKMLPAASPEYPASEVRRGNEGLSRLAVCLDTSGRVTSASLSQASGHPILDRAALNWVRNRKFTPAKVDGAPQAVCGHSVDYEWKLDR